MTLTNEQLEDVIFTISKRLLQLKNEVIAHEFTLFTLHEEQDRRFKTGEMK